MSEQSTAVATPVAEEKTAVKSSPPKKTITSKEKVSKTSSRPSTASMVMSAIKELAERNGSSLQAIKKFIAVTFTVDAEKQAPFIRKYLKSAVIDGSIIRVKGKGANGSFKLPSPKSTPTKTAKPKAAAKKKSPAVKKPVAAKKPAAKKTVEKKSSPKKTTSPEKEIKTTPAKKTVKAISKEAKPKITSSPKAKKVTKSPTAKPKAPKPKKVVAAKTAKPTKKVAPKK